MLLPPEASSPPPMTISSSSSPPPLLNPGAALVFRLTPGLGLEADDEDDMGPGRLVLPEEAFLGGGRKELKPEKRLLPASWSVRARFAGGAPSFASRVFEEEEDDGGRLTTILEGFERSTTFWKGFLPVVVVVVVVDEALEGGGFGGASESDSDSE